MSDYSPGQAEHLAAHYRLPAGYLFVPQVDFWEIVCYRADVEDGPFKLRQRDVMGLLSHPTFARTRREALRGPAPPLAAVEEEGERFYVLRPQAEGWPDETLRKLRAYVERGWIVQLGRHRHAKWVLNYLLLERQRRMERIRSVQGTPPATVVHFGLTWMKLRRALEAAKGKKVEYRKLKDGFLLLERLGIVTPLTGQPTAKLGYGQRFQHRLNVPRLLDVAPTFLRRCQQREDASLTLAQAVSHVLRILIDDYRRLKRALPWPLDRLQGEMEVDLEMQHRRRVAVRRELTWTAAGVLTQAGILRAERAGYALTPLAVEKSRDPAGLEAWALAALARIQDDQRERPALSPSEVAKLDELLAPCRQRDASRAELVRAIVLQMNYPPETSHSLFALLRRRMDRISEEQFPALLAHFANRRARGSFSLHPADILDDFAPRRKRDRRKKRVTLRKTLKGRRLVVQRQFNLTVAAEEIRRARLCCTLRNGRPLSPDLSGRPVEIHLCAGDHQLYHTTVSLLDIPDDPLAPADITGPLRGLSGKPTLTMRLTLPKRLPALRLLARIEAEVVMRKA